MQSEIFNLKSQSSKNIWFPPEAKFYREHETPAGQPPRRRRYKLCDSGRMRM